MTYYEILNVKQTASDKEIKNAYRILAKKYHPDIYKGNKKIAEDKIKKINEAYDVLSNKKLKKEYDAQFVIVENKRTSNSQNYYTRNEKQVINYYNYIDMKNHYGKKTFFEQLKEKSIQEIIMILGIIFITTIIVWDAIYSILEQFIGF